MSHFAPFATDALREILSKAVDRLEDAEPAGAHSEVLRMLNRLGSGSFRVIVDGRTALVALVVKQSGKSSEVVGARVTVPMGDVPVFVSVTGRGTFELGKPEMELADPAFHRRFRAYGSPAEVVRDVLDGAERARLLVSFDRASGTRRRGLGYLSIEKGMVTLLAPFHAHGIPTRALTIAPETLRSDIVQTLALRDRVVEAFGRHHDAIARREGPAAAQQWVRAQWAALTAAGNAEKRAIRLLLVGLLLAFAFAGALLVGFVIWLLYVR